MTDAILSMKYKVSALHMYPHVWSANKGTFGSVLPLREPSTGRSDTNTDYKKAEDIYNCPQGTEEKTPNSAR